MKRSLWSVLLISFAYVLVYSVQHKNALFELLYASSTYNTYIVL